MESMRYESHESSRSSERTREYLTELDRLLAELIEKGGELDPQIKRDLRARIDNLLQALGLYGKKGEEYLEALYDLHRQVNVEYEYEATPPKYPTKEEFAMQMTEVINAEVGDLPRVPSWPKARDVAEYAHCEWRGVGGRYTNTVDYLYEMGKLMTSRGAYDTVFPENDRILVDESWHVENGRHRSLVLKTLGTNYINRRGMNSWVIVSVEPSI